MRHQPTVLEALFEEIPWDTFERLTGRYGADDGVRSFDSRDHLIATLGASFGGLHGLRQTVAGLRPSSSPLRLIGSQAPRRSTQARACPRLAEGQTRAPTAAAMPGCSSICCKPCCRGCTAPCGRRWTR